MDSLGRDATKPRGRCSNASWSGLSRPARPTSDPMIGSAFADPFRQRADAGNKLRRVALTRILTHNSLRYKSTVHRGETSSRSGGMKAAWRDGLPADSGGNRGTGRRRKSVGGGTSEASSVHRPLPRPTTAYLGLVVDCRTPLIAPDSQSFGQGDELVVGQTGHVDGHPKRGSVRATASEPSGHHIQMSRRSGRAGCMLMYWTILGRVPRFGRLPCGNAWCQMIRSPARPPIGIDPRACRS